MNVDEVKQFLAEDEAGKALAEEIKAPILAKNKELLGEIATRNARHAEAVQRAALAEKLLADQAAQREAEEAEKKKEGLRALAAKLAADEGITLDPERFVGPDEETTRTLVSAEAERFKQYAEGILKAKFGNNGLPRGGAGSTQPAAMPLAQFDALSAEARMDFTRRGGTILGD
jgi:hypothetical protein